MLRVQVSSSVPALRIIASWNDTYWLDALVERFLCLLLWWKIVVIVVGSWSANGIRQYRVESVRFIARKAPSNQCRPKSILTIGRTDWLQKDRIFSVVKVCNVMETSATSSCWLWLPDRQKSYGGSRFIIIRKVNTHWSGIKVDT